jgi:hypothetical protein
LINSEPKEHIYPFFESPKILAYINDVLEGISSNSIGSTIFSKGLSESIGALAKAHCYS